MFLYFINNKYRSKYTHHISYGYRPNILAKVFIVLFLIIRILPRIIYRIETCCACTKIVMRGRHDDATSTPMGAGTSDVAMCLWGANRRRCNGVSPLPNVCQTFVQFRRITMRCLKLHPFSRLTSQHRDLAMIEQPLSSFYETLIDTLYRNVARMV